MTARRGRLVVDRSQSPVAVPVASRLELGKPSSGGAWRPSRDMTDLPLSWSRSTDPSSCHAAIRPTLGGSR